MAMPMRSAPSTAEIEMSNTRGYFLAKPAPIAAHVIVYGI